MKDKFMKYISALVLMCIAFFAPVFMSGCAGSGVTPGSGSGPLSTPAQQQEAAKQAGGLAVAIFLAVESGDAEETAAVKTVIDLLSATLKEYRTGGFITAKDELALLINKQVPIKYQPLANSLSGTLLNALDNLFTKHPEWKDKNEQVTAIVNSFFTGASESFGTVRSQRELKRTVPKPTN